MRYADIKDGRVDVVYEFPDPGAIEIPDHVFAGWSYDGGSFTPPEQTLDNAHAAAIERIEAGYRKTLAALHRAYPDIEREGWAEQISDAKGHQAGDDAPLLVAMAEARDMTADDLAARIVTKHTQYRTAYAGPTGTLGRLRDQADAAYQAGQIEELEAINWPQED